jgi:hypothetical protein
MRAIARIVAGAAALIMMSSAVPAQTPATSRIMRAKLAHAERVLEALMTTNHWQIEQESAALVAATRAPGWAVLQSERYARYSDDFRRAGEDLVDAAKARDSDAEMRGYLSMTLACYSCHRYLKDSRIAKYEEKSPAR